MLSASSLNKEEVPLLKEKYFLDDILDDGSYRLNLGELKTNITITGKIGSGASIEIYHTSNKKKPDLEPQKLIFLYHDIVDKMIIIQREEKSEFQYDLKNIVITIPKNIIINFKKCQGDIVVENISGAINFNEHLGSIKLSGLNGDLKIDSFGGEVNIEDSHLFSNIYLKNDNLKVKNVHGENKITILGGDLFINNFEGNLELFSISGLIELNNINGDKISCRTSSSFVRGKNIKSNLTLTNNDGDIQLKEIIGRCNLKTTTGNLLIEDSKGLINCTTSSGNIILKEISGSSDLESYFGNIYLKSIYDSSVENTFHNISTIEGNIDLEIQKDLSLSLSAEIDFNRSTQDITSEIPLNFELKDNRIVGEVSLNQGSLPIVLFSKNGYISIKAY
jgi:hypothetical protein